MRKKILSLWNTIKTDFFDFFRQKEFWKKFLFVYGTYFIGILSLLQANYLYKTDLSRVADVPYEIANWRHSGRLLNDLFTVIFNFDTYPQDISPLSELLGIFALSIASMILVYVISQKMTYPRLFFAVILGLNPYYLQVLSYVFDCLFYSIGVLAAIMPFLFYRHKPAFYTMSAIGLTCCYLIFQSTISIYMVLATYLFFTDYQNDKIPFKKLLKQSIVTILVFLGISLAYYVIVRLTYPENAEAIHQSNLCALSDCWSVFSKNTRRAVNMFLKHWAGTPMGYAFLGVLVSFLIYLLHQAWNNKRPCPRLIHVFVGLMTLFFMLFFIILWTMFFTFMYWNARIWTAVGVCFAVMMLAPSAESYRPLRRLLMFFSFALMWGCIIFATRVGNLIEIQKRYESFVFFTLAQDLTLFPQKEIFFNKRVISSPIVLKKANQYPIIADLVTGMQPRYQRFYDYFIKFYRPDVKICKNKDRQMKKLLLNNVHHSFTQINDICIEIRIK